MKKICFFSSDSRPLYKKNIFSILALPEQYIVHVRYQEKYVNFPSSSLQNLKGKECCIFFTTGNDLTQNEKDRVVGNISIRDAVIKEINLTNDTGLVHFYLELRGYKNWVIDSNQEHIIPPVKFVSELNLTDKNENEWHQRVNALALNFPTELFYKLNIYNKKENQIIHPQYNLHEKQSYLSLQDEENYYLDIAFFHTGDGTKMKSLEITFDNKVISLNVPSPINIGGLRDNRSYSIYTQSLNSKSSNCYIQFNTYEITSDKSQKIYSDYDATILLEVDKNMKRSAQFGFFTLLTALSVAYGKILTDSYSLQGTFDLALCMHTLLVAALGFFSAFKLYQLFNKK
ncbi:MAG TPA: hypothetical protein DHV28_09435 [Ignavibacteriales bacterium]|nr:hypothetical protein [Ignavibacteriales bacterium]